MDPDPERGGPKASGSRSPTLVVSKLTVFLPCSFRRPAKPSKPKRRPRQPPGPITCIVCRPGKGLGRQTHVQDLVSAHICRTPVLRIHDFLVWIRIRILPFLSLTFKTPTKNLFFKKFFCLLLFEGSFTSFFKVKKLESRFFLLFLLDDIRIRI
jgi:hypothetical protein